MVSSESSDVLTRAQHAHAAARDAASLPHEDRAAAVLAAASSSLGGPVTLDADPLVDWAEPAAVFIGDVPRGRLRFEPTPDDSANSANTAQDAAAIALPGIAAVFSRVLLHDVQDRFAPRQTSGELIAQLIVAESSRLDSLANRGYQLGVPLQLVHGVAWLTFTHVESATENPPKALQSALELFALELFDQRPELWHTAFVNDDAFVVMTEEPGAGDHQRRLREVGAAIADQAQVLGAGAWDVTLGLGTPQPGPEGLRRSAAEARVAAESAVSSGRTGHIAVTDVTGLRRVLLDFYASPVSRELLSDILSPLDAQGTAKARTAVRTLLAYLGNRNSPTKAAAELALHPNAVTYRIKNIEAALQLDLHDPDTRFAVELACRVRLIGHDGRADG
jgi:sugar diacid utilization regulator